MFDNGLLKYYKQKEYQDGVLDAKDLELVEEQKITPVVTTCVSADGRFYKRINASRGADKKITDGQVLLSQIYNRVGLQSAVYLPAQMDGRRFLLSNDVSNASNIVLAYNYISQVPSFQSKFPLDFLNERHSENLVEKYFTERALLQQSKMRVFDTASFNNDRHYENFFYTLNGDRADGVVEIDFELGSCDVNPEGKAGDAFYNDFIPFQMPRDELIGLFREDESFASLVDKQAIAEEIGSVDPVAVAKDIDETIGYKIDPTLPQFLARSFDAMAETLVQ